MTEASKPKTMEELLAAQGGTHVHDPATHKTGVGLDGDIKSATTPGPDVSGIQTFVTPATPDTTLTPAQVAGDFEAPIDGPPVKLAKTPDGSQTIIIPDGGAGKDAGTAAMAPAGTMRVTEQQPNGEPDKVTLQPLVPAPIADGVLATDVAALQGKVLAAEVALRDARQAFERDKAVLMFERDDARGRAADAERKIAANIPEDIEVKIGEEVFVARREMAGVHPARTDKIPTTDEINRGSSQTPRVT